VCSFAAEIDEMDVADLAHYESHRPEEVAAGAKPQNGESKIVLNERASPSLNSVRVRVIILHKIFLFLL